MEEIHCTILSQSNVEGCTNIASKLKINEEIHTAIYVQGLDPRRGFTLLFTE